MTVEGPPKDTAFVQGICEDDEALPQSTSTLMSSSSAPSTAPPVHDDPSSTADNAGFSHPTATVASDGENLRKKNKRASMIALVVGVVLVAVAVVAPCVVLSKRNKNYVDNDPTGTNNGPTGAENQTGGGLLPPPSPPPLYASSVVRRPPRIAILTRSRCKDFSARTIAVDR